MTLLVHDIKSAEDLPAAFDAGVREHAEALITTVESIFRAQRARVTELAAHHRLPAIYPYSAVVTDADGVLSYSIRASDLQRRPTPHVAPGLKDANAVTRALQQTTKMARCVN